MSDDHSDIPYTSPVVPEMLDDKSMLRFRCHSGVDCFNACCKNIDIQLTPYDILRLKTRLGITADEFLSNYTYPFEMDSHGLPGVKFKPIDSGTACQFMTDKGCSIYEDRPTACRYYPLGLMSMRKADQNFDMQGYALVQEPHCLGHYEDRSLTINEYRTEQGVVDYDNYSRGWRQLILKKKSAGPSIGKLSEMSLQLFFLASYNIDKFQEFITSETFSRNYILDMETLEKLKTDQTAVLEFGYRFLKQVLFGEMTIEEREGAYDARVERIKEKEAQMKEAAEAYAKKLAEGRGGES